VTGEAPSHHSSDTCRVPFCAFGSFSAKGNSIITLDERIGKARLTGEKGELQCVSL